MKVFLNHIKIQLKERNSLNFLFLKLGVFYFYLDEKGIKNAKILRIKRLKKKNLKF